MDTSATVFVIDDEASIRRGLANLLGAAGYDSETYANGDTFLAAVGDRAGCVILDLQMPDRDGLELQSELRAVGIQLPVIFLTGHGDVPTTARAMKEGATDFLEKPVDETILLSAVDNALRKDHEVRADQAHVSAIKARLASLTEREDEVLRHVIAGQLNKRIARTLGISEKTVKVHRAHVMEKLDVHSVAELVRMTEAAGVSPASRTTTKVQ